MIPSTASPVRDRAGFSLVEALIALVMLSTGVLAMAGALSVTNRAARDSLEAVVAEHLARQKMEELRDRPSPVIGSGSETLRVDGIAFRREWSLGPGPRAGLSEIRVEVVWSEYAAPLTTSPVKPLTGGATPTLPDAGTALSQPDAAIDETLDDALGHGRVRRRAMTGYTAN